MPERSEHMHGMRGLRDGVDVTKAWLRGLRDGDDVTKAWLRSLRYAALI
jgi:hypothetical protein